MPELTPYQKHRRSVARQSNYLPYNALEDFFNDPWIGARMPLESFRIDVSESEKEYKVEADLPGVRKDEIDLSMDEGRLTISVQRDESTEENQEGYMHRERRYGSLRRSVNLTNAGTEGIQASLNDGVLTVKVPKHQKPDTTKKITIQ